MKANEAPEKIFLSRNALGVLCDSWWLEPDKSLDNVEYVRTDAFIEKAKEWFQEQNEWFDPNGVRHCGLEDFEDFVNYMKGE